MLGRIVAAMMAVTLGIQTAPASAGTVCPDSSIVFATFDCTYSGNYKPGQPYDYVTIWPRGFSDSFAASGITIHVLLKDCQGAPLPGIRPEVRNDSLCICPTTNRADAPTDANGRTRFTGGMAGKGWATKLFVYADNVLVGSVPVKINGVGPASSSDTIRQDFNEDGFVDVVDWVIWNDRADLGQPSCSPIVVQEVRP
jgi:hypothetical protein